MLEQGLHPHPGPPHEGTSDGEEEVSLDPDTFLFPGAGPTEYGLSLLNGQGPPDIGIAEPSSTTRDSDRSEDELIEDVDGNLTPAAYSIRSDDDDDELGETTGSRESGLFDWYGDLTRHDNLCRGRREAVIGSELVVDYAHQPYQWPPLSRLQAAILSGGLVGEDPSSEKKQRWNYDDSW